MKKLLLISTLLICGIATAKAQSSVYQPFMPNQSQPSLQQQAPTVRTTAYFLDTFGQNLYKVPIRIQQQGSGNMASYYVVEYYQDSGIGGQWKKLLSPARISMCNSMFSSNPLEGEFMYKALVNTQTYYFDF